MFRAFFFRRPVILESAATRPLPRGGGLGRGHSPNCSNLSNTFTTQIQALWLVALSLTLSHVREDRVAVGVKGSARKIGCAGCFSVALPYFFPLITFIISIKCGFNSANSGLSLFSSITSPISFSLTAKRCAISGVKPSRCSISFTMPKILSWLGA